jgi:hypothetical protein
VELAQLVGREEGEAGAMAERDAEVGGHAGRPGAGFERMDEVVYEGFVAEGEVVVEVEVEMLFVEHG